MHTLVPEIKILVKDPNPPKLKPWVLAVTMDGTQLASAGAAGDHEPAPNPWARPADRHTSVCQRQPHGERSRRRTRAVLQRNPHRGPRVRDCHGSRARERWETEVCPPDAHRHARRSFRQLVGTPRRPCGTCVKPPSQQLGTTSIRAVRLRSDGRQRAAGYRKMAALMNDLRRMRHLQIILVPRGLPMPKPNWAKQTKTGIMHALEILCIGTEKIEGRLSRRTFPGRPVKKILEVILTTHTVSSPSTNGAITEASPLSPSV